jgi:hypothetical protein
MLRPDPADRTAEARANGWHGEVERLQVSLTAACAKLTALDRTAQDTTQAPPTSACPPTAPPGRTSALTTTITGQLRQWRLSA